jgi:hypothetical protein
MEGIFRPLNEKMTKIFALHFTKEVHMDKLART